MKFLYLCFPQAKSPPSAAVTGKKQRKDACAAVTVSPTSVLGPGPNGVVASPAAVGVTSLAGQQQTPAAPLQGVGQLGVAGSKGSAAATGGAGDPDLICSTTPLGTKAGARTRKGHHTFSWSRFMTSLCDIICSFQFCLIHAASSTFFFFFKIILSLDLC